MSRPVGAAFDPESNTLWGVTYGGEGFLYAFDIDEERWTARSMNNVDVGGIIFDPETGNLITVPDPDDDRVVRYKSTDSERHQLTARRMAGRLLAIQPSEIQEAADQRPFGTATYDALIAVLQAFADVFDDGVRIRGIKMAVIILQASYSGEGITPSQIARRSGGALETVRRSIQEHVEMGILRTEEDPEDHRAYRVFYKDPESVTRHLDRIAQSLDQVDWAAFNLNDD